MKRKIWLLMAMGMMLASCVHEWPEPTGEPRKVVLNVHHRLEWNPAYEWNVSRAADAAVNVRYHFQITPAGDRSKIVHQEERYSDDLTRADFSLDLNIPPGDYDLWCWSDHADASTGKSKHYDSSDFNTIPLSAPHVGNDDAKESFRGVTRFTVEASVYADYRKDVDIALDRPMAKYQFVSTDLEEFMEKEMAKGNASALEGYRVRMYYTGYLPTVYDNFQNRPVNSKTGVSFEGTIVPLNEKEALLGFDYLMVNGNESSVPVALEIFNPSGIKVGYVAPIDVPTQRNRLTVVKGRFLTSSATGGIGINPDFNGDFNIEIR